MQVIVVDSVEIYCYQDIHHNKGKHMIIEEYFKAQPEKTKQALLELKQCILEIVPDTVELITYNIPAYALVKDGKRDQQIMIAGYKNHVGLYPHPTTMERFDKELKEYKKGKGSVQFPVNKPLPTAFIKKMVEYRMSLLRKVCKK